MRRYENRLDGIVGSTRQIEACLIHGDILPYAVVASDTEDRIQPRILSSWEFKPKPIAHLDRSLSDELYLNGPQEGAFFIFPRIKSQGLASEILSNWRAVLFWQRLQQVISPVL